MVAPPGSLKTDREIVGYYHTVADRLGNVPWVLQDFPLVTGVKIDPALILQIIDDCPTCVMLKHEDWPGLEKITTLRKASDAGSRRISILCGNGGMYLLEELLRGADGAMTGFGYPEMMRQVLNAFLGGDIDLARDIFDAYMPMIRYEAQPGMGLAIRKHSLAISESGGSFLSLYPSLVPPHSNWKSNLSAELAAIAELPGLASLQIRFEARNSSSEFAPFKKLFL